MPVIPAIDDDNDPIPIMLNGTKIMFTEGGREDSSNATTFTIDFKKIAKFYRDEKGEYPI